MSFNCRILAVAVCTASLLTSQRSQPAGKMVDPAVFKDPPAEFRGHEMYGYGQFNLSNLSVEKIRADVDTMAKRNFGGFAVEPGGGPTTGLPADYLKATGRKPSSEGTVYLSDDYFKFYRAALEEARKNGLEVILYDEWAYPTGMVDGQLYAKYPQHIAKSLEMAETNVTGPGKAELNIPGNLYIGAVMMNRDTFELVDISSRRGREAAGDPGPQGQLESDGVLSGFDHPAGLAERGVRRLSGPGRRGRLHLPELPEALRPHRRVLREGDQVLILGRAGHASR